MGWLRGALAARAGQRVVALNNILLFLAASMYLGTGWSLILFSHPVSYEFTVADYYNQIVPQVTLATRFFTPVTMAMMGFCVVMAVAECDHRLRWAPVVVLVAVLAATGMTTLLLFPLNDELRRGVTEQARLEVLLADWRRSNIIRVLFWSAEWLAMMAYFAVLAQRAKGVENVNRYASH